MALTGLERVPLQDPFDHGTWIGDCTTQDIADLGAVGGPGDAVSLRGVAISTVAPAAGQFLGFNVGDGRWTALDIFPEIGDYLAEIPAWGEPGFVDPAVGDDSQGWVALSSGDADVTVGYGSDGVHFAGMTAGVNMAIVGVAADNGSAATMRATDLLARVQVHAATGQTLPLLHFEDEAGTTIFEFKQRENGPGEATAYLRPTKPGSTSTMELYAAETDDWAELQISSALQGGPSWYLDSFIDHNDATNTYAQLVLRGGAEQTIPLIVAGPSVGPAIWELNVDGSALLGDLGKLGPSTWGSGDHGAIYDPSGTMDDGGLVSFGWMPSGYPGVDFALVAPVGSKPSSDGSMYLEAYLADETSFLEPRLLGSIDLFVSDPTNTWFGEAQTTVIASADGSAQGGGLGFDGQLDVDFLGGATTYWASKPGNGGFFTGASIASTDLSSVLYLRARPGQTVPVIQVLDGAGDAIFGLLADGTFNPPLGGGGSTFPVSGGVDDDGNTYAITIDPTTPGAGTFACDAVNGTIQTVTVSHDFAQLQSLTTGVGTSRVFASPIGAHLQAHNDDSSVLSSLDLTLGSLEVHLDEGTPFEWVFDAATGALFLSPIAGDGNGIYRIGGTGGTLDLTTTNQGDGATFARLEQQAGVVDGARQSLAVQGPGGGSVEFIMGLLGTGVPSGVQLSVDGTTVLDFGNFAAGALFMQDAAGGGIQIGHDPFGTAGVADGLVLVDRGAGLFLKGTIPTADPHVLNQVYAVAGALMLSAG